MDPILGAGLIGGAASLIGGLLNRDANREANNSAAAAADKNTQYQKEFAQSGIQWRVEDAKKAGINPLAALGASTSQYAPSYVGSTPDTSAGDTMHNMGQNISRAMQASGTEGDRTFNRLVQAETLTNMKLKNELLAHQITSVSTPSNPAFPSPMDASGMGQGNMPVTIKKAEITASQPGVPAQEAGAINDYGFVRTHGGGYAVVPSSDVKQRTEDNLIEELHWAARNKMQPFLQGVTPPDPSRYPLPKGATHWEWHPFKQEFRPGYPKSRFDQAIEEFRNQKYYWKGGK